jgi:hypothetical protein
MKRYLLWIDRRFALPRAGFLAGMMLGALYTLQSSSHMIVQSPHDPYIIGVLLALIGGLLGWLTGVLLRRPLSASNQAQSRETGESNTQ